MLVGFVPGVTLTVKSDESPNGTEFGFAEPVPVGLVGGTTDGCAITDVSHPNNYLMEKPTRAVAIAHFERARCIEEGRTRADLKNTKRA